MVNYLEILEKFKDMKDIADLIDEVKKLRFYYQTGQYQSMKHHIDSLVIKYLKDTVKWNLVNPEMPTTYEQAYINAESFLSFQGSKMIVKQVFNYGNRLTCEELAYIESMIKPME